MSMSWVIYDISHMFICLLRFCHGLPKGEIVRTYVFHMLKTYVTNLCNLLILWPNALYLYFGRSRMCLMLQETRFQETNASRSRTYMFHMLGTYVTNLCNLLILWPNALYLYFGKSRMCLMLQETRFQVQVLK